MKAVSVLIILGSALLAYGAYQKGLTSSSEVHPSIRSAHLAWMKARGHSYSSPQEYEYRLRIFAKNDQYIKEENSKQTSYTLGHNKFSDLTDKEFKARYASYERPDNFYEKLKSVKSKPEKRNVVAQEFDWIKFGAVSPVQDQGDCSASYAFATAGAAEASYYIPHAKENKTMMVGSAAQIRDCSFKQGNRGCQGGNLEYSLVYLQRHLGGGLNTIEDYPYSPVTGKCEYEWYENKIPVRGWETFQATDCASIERTVLITPVVITIDTAPLKFYQSGIFDMKDCPVLIDGLMLIVAGGNNNGTNYYTAKNSWGSNWGEKGFIRLSRDISQHDGICGMCIAAGYIELSKK